jgi:hypothetical protein
VRTLGGWCKGRQRLAPHFPLTSPADCLLDFCRYCCCCCCCFRYEQLKSALRSPEVAQALAAQFPFRRLLVELVKYVERALNALPCFLLVSECVCVCVCVLSMGLALPRSVPSNVLGAGGYAGG